MSFCRHRPKLLTQSAVGQKSLPLLSEQLVARLPAPAAEGSATKQRGSMMQLHENDPPGQICRLLIPNAIPYPPCLSQKYLCFKFGFSINELFLLFVNPLLLISSGRFLTDVEVGWLTLA